MSKQEIHRDIRKLDVGAAGSPGCPGSVFDTGLTWTRPMTRMPVARVARVIRVIRVIRDARVCLGPVDRNRDPPGSRARPALALLDRRHRRAPPRAGVRAAPRRRMRAAPAARPMRIGRSACETPRKMPLTYHPSHRHDCASRVKFHGPAAFQFCVLARRANGPPRRPVRFQVVI
jgi:hypothetical protein